MNAISMNMNAFIQKFLLFLAHPLYAVAVVLCDRVKRMGQEQKELLDECDLDEHERETDRGEVGGDAQSRPSRLLALYRTVRADPQRQQDQHQARDNRLDQ